MLIAYGAVSGRLRSTPVSQAMVFVALGHLDGGRVLDLVEADTANQFVRHLAEAILTLVLFCDTVRVNRAGCGTSPPCRDDCSGSAYPSPSWPAPWPGWPCSPS
jgi:hypothetical protein